jgi:carbonic anhydrase
MRASHAAPVSSIHFLIHGIEPSEDAMNFSTRMRLQNIAWVHETEHVAPRLLERMGQGQSPKILWIGCSDSRVPIETITRANPGEIFVHRNIANLVLPSDDNTMSVVEYAVHALGVDEIVVCGHEGCGGVRAALFPIREDLPRVARRIAPLCQLAHAHRDTLDRISDSEARIDRLAELNVLQQVRTLRQSDIVRNAGRPLGIHGWIFNVGSGRIRTLVGDGTLA